MFKRLLEIAAAIVLCTTPVCGAEKTEAVVTQKDLARMIVAQYGWGAGLPREPADRDYLVILGGRRSFRFEAENSYNPATDRVTVAEYSQYGPFSGRGWLRGVSETSDVSFTLLLPIGGEYTLKAVVKGDEFVWHAGGKEYRSGSSASSFKEVVIGTVDARPGVMQMKVTVPAQGGIDSFAFVAPDYRQIQPFAGWRFSEPLTAERLAEVVFSLMSAYGQLPEDTRDSPKPVAVADVALPTQDAAPSTITYLGPFSSRRWLRADLRGATLQIPLKVAQTGLYSLRARLMGQTIAGDVNGYAFTAAGKSYLELVELGIFRLESGENMLTLTLPPKGGIDIIEYSRKRTSAADFMQLAGVNGAPDRLVTAAEAQDIIKAIYEKHPVRK